MLKIYQLAFYIYLIGFASWYLYFIELDVFSNIEIESNFKITFILVVILIKFTYLKTSILFLSNILSTKANQ